MNTIVQKISAPGSIDLSTLSVKELNRLSFDEEVAAAGKIRASAPFSEERNRNVKEGYALINRIAEEKARRQGLSVRSYGANDACCRLVKKLIRRHRRQTGKETLTFYEAGVGTGLVIRSLLGDNSLHIKGCDVNIGGHLKNNPRFDLYEGAIFDALQQVEDASIDLFYWNDVLEHILDDEIDAYLQLIYRKIATGGVVVTITPNRLYGPCDVTRLFYPPGTKAMGFHFHEYTYSEVVKLYRRHGFTPACSIAVNPISCNYFIISNLVGVGGVKCLIEKIAPAIRPLLLKKRLLQVVGCHVSVVKQSDKQ
jgi:SAM-dependent methyltransferase